MQQGKSLETTTIEELFAEDTSGAIPVLIDITHPDIIWSDSSNAQENGHLRLINNPVAVMYQGKKYMPSCFSFDPPQEDGKKIGNASITISAIDQRCIEVIRSVASNPTVYIDAVFTKLSETQFMFAKVFHYEFEMGAVTWDGVSAKWQLTYDPASKLNLPRDLATMSRTPAITEADL